MKLTEQEKELVRALQDGFPLVERPYAEIARKSGWEEADVISKLNEWREGGVLRRISAYIRHQRAGFKANGMGVWDVPEEQLEEIGNRMAGSPMVSHCYARPKTEKFPYRLYTMIHGQSKDDVYNEALRLSKQENIQNYKVLFSMRELKRSTTRLFTEEKYEPKQ